MKNESLVLGGAVVAGLGAAYYFVGKSKEEEDGGETAYNPLEGIWGFLSDLMNPPVSGAEEPDPDPYPDTPPEGVVDPSLVLADAPPMVKKYVADPHFEKIVQHPSGSREIVLSYDLKTPAEEKYIRSSQFSEIITHPGGGREIVLTGGSSSPTTKASTSKKSTYIRRSQKGYTYTKTGKLTKK